jgi:fumarate hydratase class II
VEHGIERIEASLPRLAELAQGGTAVGTGINAHPRVRPRAASAKLAEWTGAAAGDQPANYFESLSTQDAAVEL